MNTQSKIVEYNLEASDFTWEIAPGKGIQAWGFNGQLPETSCCGDDGAF
ncbi:MAG: hypothetical protein ABJB16_11640 [Saprospiraceae bacterium]